MKAWKTSAPQSAAIHIVRPNAAERLRQPPGPDTADLVVAASEGAVMAAQPRRIYLEVQSANALGADLCARVYWISRLSRTTTRGT